MAEGKEGKKMLAGGIKIHVIQKLHTAMQLGWSIVNISAIARRVFLYIFAEMERMIAFFSVCIVNSPSQIDISTVLFNKTVLMPVCLFIYHKSYCHCNIQKHLSHILHIFLISCSPSEGYKSETNLV